MDKQTITNPVEVNYDKLVDMIPKELGYSKRQLQFSDDPKVQSSSHSSKQLIDLNFSGYLNKKEQEGCEMDHLNEQDVPNLKVHNAEECYQDAKKLSENQLMTVDQIKALIKDKKSHEEFIVSQYTSPLYLANL